VSFPRLLTSSKGYDISVSKEHRTVPSSN
jgi:hypothetical protein